MYCYNEKLSNRARASPSSQTLSHVLAFAPLLCDVLRRTRRRRGERSASAHLHISFFCNRTIFIKIEALPLSPEYSGLCVKTSVLSFVGQFAEYAVSSARLATIQDTIRETECPASDVQYTPVSRSHQQKSKIKKTKK